MMSGMAHQTFWLLLALIAAFAAVFFTLRAGALTRRRQRETRAREIREDVIDDPADASTSDQGEPP
jgi:hypothetical protein